MRTDLIAKNPEITPVGIVGITVLAVFGILIADMGIVDDIPNFALMGAAMFVMAASGIVSLAIDHFAPRTMPCSRIVKVEGGVTIGPHRVSAVRLASGAVGAFSTITFLVSFIPIMWFFPGVLITAAIDVPIFVGLLFFVFFMLKGRYAVEPILLDTGGFTWSAYGWRFSANWNDIVQLNSLGEWQRGPQHVTIVARPGAIIARPRVPRFVYHRRVPWKKWAPGLQALDIQCGPQFLDVPPPYLENLLKFFIERPEDRVRLSRREGLELVQNFFAAGIQENGTHDPAAPREEDMWGGVL